MMLLNRNVSPLQTLRRDTDADVLRLRWTDSPRIIVNLALVSSVVAIALLRARTPEQALWMSGATGIAILALAISAGLLMWAARRGLRSGWPYVVRQGVANLYRPGNQTRAVTLALGFGAFLISTLYLVQRNVLRQFATAAAESPLLPIATARLRRSRSTFRGTGSYSQQRQERFRVRK
mgnify:CR=1 FL=1